MADNNSEHGYYVPRDSYMSVSAEMQGFLDKKGVLGNKSKLWCSIQQSTLYMQKTNAQKSPKQGDIVKTIDLKDCHQVRKVTAEITGTHLEICQKKKSHVFVCPTSENCTMWVKALQAAMALKDAGQIDSNPAEDGQDSSHVYESYSDILRQSQIDAVLSCKIADYSEPSDAKKASTAENNNNDYWEVGHAAISFNQSQTAAKSIDDRSQNAAQSIGDHSNRQSLNEQTYSDAKSEALEAGRCECEQEIYTDGISLAAEKKTMSVTSQVNSELAQRNSVVRRVSSSNQGIDHDAFSTSIVRRVSSSNQGIDHDAFSTTSLHQCLPAIAINDLLKPSDSEDLKDGENDGEDEGPFLALLDSLTSRDSPIPDYVHPLTEEDIKPFEDLQQFLDINHELCHVDCLFRPVDDPVNSLKSYLKTLSITEMGH